MRGLLAKLNFRATYRPTLISQLNTRVTATIHRAHFLEQAEVPPCRCRGARSAELNLNAVVQSEVLRGHVRRWFGDRTINASAAAGGQHRLVNDLRRPAALVIARYIATE